MYKTPNKLCMYVCMLATPPPPHDLVISLQCVLFFHSVPSMTPAYIGCRPGFKGNGLLLNSFVPVIFFLPGGSVIYPDGGQFTPLPVGRVLCAGWRLVLV